MIAENNISNRMKRPWASMSITSELILRHLIYISRWSSYLAWIYSNLFESEHFYGTLQCALKEKLFLPLSHKDILALIRALHCGIWRWEYKSNSFAKVHQILNCCDWYTMVFIVHVYVWLISCWTSWRSEDQHRY